MLELTGVVQEEDQSDYPCQNDMSCPDQEARAEDILEHGPSRAGQHPSEPDGCCVQGPAAVCSMNVPRAQEPATRRK